MSLQEWLSIYEKAHGKVVADVRRGSLTFGDGNPMMTMPTKLIEVVWRDLMRYVEGAADVLIKSMGRTFGEMHGGGQSVEYIDLHFVAHGFGRVMGNINEVTIISPPIPAGGDPRPIALFLAGFLEGVIGGTYDGECTREKCVFKRLAL
ncbi:hypothetical protein GCM10007981_09920 [Thermocladium modestius]|uniref:Uncharacterized protein n=1 Tax=Thermocladium modestius TaxID=62609 RepID=A0A830GTA6_9CREN|nr:hypothetical protein [Thermocladium modestius]GGP20716.1 hypothetical protein GCM10007981_09920 [Thermocladium modestius]